MMADAGEPVRDERLRLVMLCAHPSLSRENAAALTLRLVLGVSTSDIARLFLMPTPTMAARLTRARKSLAGEQFDVPSGPGARTTGGDARPTSPTSRSRRATRRRAGPSWSAASWPARRSGWRVCCATCCPAASSSTACWR